MSTTLSDVARAAGVSSATASRVLNGRRYVAPETRTRVEAAARALDYVPNRAARDLSLARTATVAFLVHHAQYPADGQGTFGARVLDGASARLAAAGHDLLYVAVDDAAVASLPSHPALRRGRADGAILLGPAFPGAALAQLRDGTTPVVLVDNLFDGVDAVLADNDAGIRSLAEHLISVHAPGWIICLAGPRTWVSTRERVTALREVARRSGIRVTVHHAPETTVADGERLGGQLGGAGGLDRAAIVAVNDAMAIGAIRALRARGVTSLPPIVGFDDTAWAQLTDPPLTSVAVDAAAMGAAAAELLLERISQVPRARRVVRAAATLRLRASCGCAGPPLSGARSGPSDPASSIGPLT